MPPVKVWYSRTYGAKRQRIRRMPKLIINLIMAILKRDAGRVIREFQRGIITRSFQLVELDDKTITRKRNRGMERPETPLYGRGLEEDKSYVNMLKIRRLKNGWKVYPRWARHHKSKLRLRDLLTVHEFGTIIRGRSGALIRIPPRPALLKAHEKVLGRKRAVEPTAMVRRAITQYVYDGRAQHFLVEEERFLQGMAKFEE